MITKTKFPSVIKPKPVVSPMEIKAGLHAFPSSCAEIAVRPRGSDKVDIKIHQGVYEKGYQWFDARSLRELSALCLEMADILDAN